MDRSTQVLYIYIYIYIYISGRTVYKPTYMTESAHRTGVVITHIITEATYTSTRHTLMLLRYRDTLYVHSEWDIWEAGHQDAVL